MQRAGGWRPRCDCTVCSRQLSFRGVHSFATLPPHAAPLRAIEPPHITCQAARFPQKQCYFLAVWAGSRSRRLPVTTVVGLFSLARRSIFDVDVTLESPPFPPALHWPFLYFRLISEALVSPPRVVVGPYRLYGIIYLIFRYCSPSLHQQRYFEFHLHTRVKNRPTRIRMYTSACFEPGCSLCFPWSDRAARRQTTRKRESEHSCSARERAAC